MFSLVLFWLRPRYLLNLLGAGYRRCRRPADQMVDCLLYLPSELMTTKFAPDSFQSWSLCALFVGGDHGR